MELRHLVTFAAVLRARTFVATARLLHYSQSTVTLHVQELERELGVTLFRRSGKRLVLTDAGRELDIRSRQILDAVDDLKRNMASLRSGQGGTVRFGVVAPTADVRLPAILADVNASAPGLELHVEVAGSEAIARGVSSGDLDFGIATAADQDLSLTFEPLFVERLLLVIPRRTHLARQHVVRARDLADMRIVLTEKGCAYRAVVENAFANAGCALRVAHEMGSVAAVLSSARAGLGIGIVPKSAIPARLSGVIIRPVSDVKLQVTIGILLRVGLGPPAEAVTFVLNRLRRGLSLTEGRHGGRETPHR